MRQRSPRHRYNTKKRKDGWLGVEWISGPKGLCVWCVCVCVCVCVVEGRWGWGEGGGRRGWRLKRVDLHSFDDSWVFNVELLS